MTQYSNIRKYNRKEKRIYMSNYTILLVVKMCNMGTKIHTNSPFQIRRREDFKVFKNKLKNYSLQNYFYFP
jgi:hypothetical protein